MVEYKCFKCGSKIDSSQLEKRFACSNCESKIFYKPRTKATKLKAE